MYIGGSLACNSFNCETSDIDCYIITTHKLSESIIKNIAVMHEKFYSCTLQYAKKIEASYIPLIDFLNFTSDHTRPYFNEGCFCLTHYGLIILLNYMC